MIFTYQSIGIECALPLDLLLLDLSQNLSQSKFITRGLADYDSTLLFLFAGFTVHVVKLLKRSSKTLTDSVEDIEEELMKVTVIKLLYDTQRKFIMEIEFFKTEETTQHE